MWLSICGFGMIIGTHPHLSEALGSCHPKLDSSSWTRFVILNSIQDRWIHPQAINVAAYICPESSSGWRRIKSGMTATERLTWKRMYSSFIVHYALFIMHCSLWNEVRRKPIMNYALWIVHYETRFGVSQLWIMHCALWIMHYIMFARACVCEGCWTIWTHFTVKSGALR